MKKTNKKPKRVTANKKTNTENNVIQFPKKQQQSTGFVRTEKPYSHPFSKFMKVQAPANAYLKIKEYGTRIGRIKKVA